MTELSVTVRGAEAEASALGAITGGTVGLPVRFSFDESWEGLTRTAVFRAGSVTRDQVDILDSTTVPWEVLEKVGCRLYVGVYGANGDGSTVIPTVWAEAGEILPGADPTGDESADPTLPVWQQVLQGGVKTVVPDAEGSYSCRLWELDCGVYHVPNGTRFFYNGAAGADFYTMQCQAMMMVATTAAGKNAYVFEQAGEGSYMLFAFSSATFGTYGRLNFSKLAQYTSPITWAQTQTFAKQPIITAQMPDTSDSSTKAATTAWVQKLLKKEVNGIKTVQPDENGEYHFRIHGQEAGVYFLPYGTKIYPMGETGTTTFSTDCDVIMTIAIHKNGDRDWLYMNSQRQIRIGWTNANNCGYDTISTAVLLDRVSDQTISGVKTFAGQPKMTATLSAGDNSTNIPNTAWVNAAIQAALAERGL